MIPTNIKHINKNYQYFASFLVIVLFCNICTLLNAWVPFTAINWLMVTIGFVAIVVFNPKILKSNHFAYLGLYSLIVLVNYLNGDVYFSNLPRVLRELVAIFFAYSLSCYALKSMNKPLIIRYFCISIIVVILIAAIGSFLADSFFPGAIRYAQSLNKYGESDAFTEQMFRLGMTNYFLPHALPVLVPCFIAGIKHSKSKVKRIIALISLSALLFIILLSGTTTPLILSIIILFISIFSKKGSVKDNLVLIFIAAFLFGFFSLISDYIAMFIRNMAEMMGSEGSNTANYQRLYELSDYLLYGDKGEDMSLRSELYDKTTQAFVANPLLGTDDAIGGHSALLDRLAALGIIGITPLVVFLFSTSLFFLKKLKRSYHFYYLLGVTSAIVMLISKNMANTEMWLCLLTFLPLLLMYYDTEKQL